MRIWKILIKAGVVLLAVVAAVLLARAVLNFTEGRALTRALAGLKTKGVPLTAGELSPPCPDEDNAARLWKAYENMTIIPGRATAGRKGRTVKAIEAREIVTRAWNALSAGKALAPADRAALEDVIVKNAKALELVAEMGDKPCFLYRDPARPLSGQPFPDAIQWIATAKLLVLSALFSAEEGDVRGAVDTFLAGLRFTPLASREGNSISFLISLATTRALSQFLGDICRGRAVEEADLLALMAAMEPGPWRERLAASFRGERVWFVEVGEDLFLSGLGDLGSVFEGSSFWEKLGLWAIRPLLKRDARRSLPWFEFVEAQAGLPYYRSREALRDRDKRLREAPWYAYLSKSMLGSAEATFLKTAQIEAVMLANRTGLACRLYKSRTGRYPEALGELVPGLLAEVPIDPFTGEPLVYRREGDGFIVYSLGSNEKDDGGRSTFMITRLVMEKDDDWSWKEER